MRAPTLGWGTQQFKEPGQVTNRRESSTWKAFSSAPYTNRSHLRFDNRVPQIVSARSGALPAITSRTIKRKESLKEMPADGATFAIYLERSALPAITMRIRSQILGILVFAGLLVCLDGRAETLEKLELIAARYPTLATFLNDSKAVMEYREALKAYMGEGDSFDPIYDEFIRQIKEVNEKIPVFGDQAWRLNPNWRKEGFSIQGEYSGSGLEIKREALLSAIEELKSETSEAAAKVSPDKAHLEKLVGELRAAYGLLSESEIMKLSGKSLRDYNGRLGGDKQRGLPKVSEHPAAKALTLVVANEMLQHDERLVDALYSGDADIIASALKKLGRLTGAKDVVKAQKLEIPEDVLGYLAFDSPAYQKIKKSYDEGVKSTKGFRHIADARIDPTLLAKMQHLQGQGIETADIPNHLTPSENQKLKEWQAAAVKVRGEKYDFASTHNQQNPYFSYDLHEDPARGTLRIKSDSGLELHFIPSPRPFHAFFAGKKTGECVGGRDCEGLVPKRWARGAMKGAVSLFTETGDGRMEGMVGLTRLVHVSADGDPESYHVVDLMSRAIKGDIVVRDADDRLIKYSFFDRFVDRYSLPQGSHGLVISDGNSVSQNIGGGEVVLHSPAYLEDRIVGKPEDFNPFDPMANEISTQFPKTMFDYGKGGMIYDGMKGDGTKVVKLIPTADRRRWSKEELEDDIMQRLLVGEEISDNDVVWKRARESGVRLERVTYYQDQFGNAHSPLVNRASEKLRTPLANHPGSELAVRAANDLSRAIKAHPTESALVSRDIVDALAANLVNHSGTNAAAGAMNALHAAIVAQPSNEALLDSRIIAGLHKNLIDHPGTEAAKSAENAAKALLKAGVIAHPESSEILSLVETLLVDRPGTESEKTAAQVLEKAIIAHPKSPQIISLIEKLLVDHSGTEAAKNAATVLGRAIKAHPTEKSLIASNLLQAISGNLSQHAETSAGQAAANTWGTAIEAHRNERSLISSDLLHGLFLHLSSVKRLQKYGPSMPAFQGLAYALEAFPDEAGLITQDSIAAFSKYLDAYQGTGMGMKGAQVLATLIKAHPTEEALASPDLLRQLAGFFDPVYGDAHAVEAWTEAIKAHPKNEWVIKIGLRLIEQRVKDFRSKNYKNLIDFFDAAIKAHPAKVLLSSESILEYVSKNSALKNSALTALFSPEHKRDLVRVVRAGTVPFEREYFDLDKKIVHIPFVMDELAKRAKSELPAEVIQIQDSRTARRALGATQGEKIDCGRLFEQLYLQYGR